MINTLIGTKKGMTSTYDLSGKRVGATVVQVEPNYITQIKTSDGKDGYNALQLATGAKKSVKKPQIGHFKKAGIDQKLRYVKEARVKGEMGAEIGLGQQVAAKDVFVKGDLVKVTGTSKGRGFQGGVKRYNFQGGPKTHGQSDRHWAPGSIGSGTTPGRVYKGKRMAGHMGVDQVSYTGLEIISVDKINNLVLIKGGLPGPNGGVMVIEKQGHVKGHTPEVEEESQEETTDVSVESQETVDDQSIEVSEASTQPEEEKVTESETKEAEQPENKEAEPEKE